MNLQVGEYRSSLSTRRETKEKIFQTLRADIISQKLKPGQAVREEDLANRFGVSRTPIREMLLRLEYEDLVKLVPNRGVFVSELMSKDIEEVIEIRLTLETTAARMAASKLTEQHISELNNISEELDVAVELQDSIVSFGADSRLHNLILEAAGNHRAHKIINNLMGQIHRIRFISGHKPGRINTTTSEQKEIIRALLNKDPAKAEEAMRIHLLNTKELLLPSSEMERKFEEFVRNSVPI